jgi:hypothetical protein
MGWISNLLNKADLSAVHTGLDIVGMTPLFGNVADLANSAIYAAKGDVKNAGISLTAAIPGAGQAIAGARLATKGAKALKADDIAKATKATKEATEKTAEAKKALDATKAAKAKLSAEASRTPGLGFPSKSKLTKEAQENLATKGGILKQARASQQQARTAKTAADKKANRKITGKERLDMYADRVRSGNALTSKIGGKGFISKSANVLIPTERIDPESLQPKSPNEETEKKPELPKDEGEETRPLIDDNLRDKPRPTPQGDGLGLGDGIAKAIDTITTEVEAGVEEGKQLAEKAKKEQQDNYTKRAAITAEMDDLMTQDPDYFRKNRGAANVMFQKARELGVTADQFNSYVRNNKTAAEARRRDIDRDEAKQFLEEKLDQPLYESSRGMPTSAQKGRNLARFMKASGLKNATPAQVSSLMNRGTALRQAKDKEEKNKPKTTSRTA